MPIAASGTSKRESSPMTRYYHHLLPKPPPPHSQLSPALLSPGGGSGGSSGGVLFGATDGQPPPPAALGRQEPPTHLFATHTPPSLLNLAPGVNSPPLEPRSSPTTYDLRDFPQRRGMQELRNNGSPAPLSPSYFSMFCTDDPSQKSESPSRKRRRVSISSHGMMDLAGSPTPPPGRLWEQLGNDQQQQQRPRRRISAQRRIAPPDRCNTPRNNRRSPTLHPGSKCRELLPPPWPSGSPGEQRSFPPATQHPPPPHPHHHGFHGLNHQATAASQGQGNSAANQQPLLLPNVPVSIPITLSSHNLPLYSGPHHIPVCSAPHLAPCNMSTVHSCASIQFPPCQTQPMPSCNLHLPHHHHAYPPLLHHHHHSVPSHGAGHAMLPTAQHHLLPPTQYFGPQSFNTQAQDGEMDLLSEHRPSTNFHSLPPGALASGPTVPPSPPLHLLQDPLMRSSPADFSQLGSYGNMRRMNQSRRMANRRWRGPPMAPTPTPYPGFIFHFLAMLSNPSVPPYGQDIPSPETTEAENYEALLTLAERLGEAKPRGLLKAEIEQLPSYRFNVDTRQSDQTSCVICMCDFEQRQLLRVLPCNHEFHAKCVDKWLKTNRTCPICRGDSSEYFHQPE